MTIDSHDETNGTLRGASRRRWRRCRGPAAILTLSLSGCVSGQVLRWESSDRPPPVRPAPAATAAAAVTPTPTATTAATGPKTAQDKDDRQVSRTAATDPKSVKDKDDRQVSRVGTPTAPDIPLVNDPPVVPPAPADYQIDLSTALRLAEVENPEIAGARQRIFTALAALQGARALLLPSLNAGTSYNYHGGNLQRSSGRILDLYKQAFYVGGGAGAVTASTVEVPMINIYTPLTDALFNPLVESQRVDQTRLSARATTNSVLLEVATLHFDLISAEIGLKLRRDTEAEAYEVARRTREFAAAGQARQADANRAAADAMILKRAVQKGEEELAVASIRLAHRLHLDPSVRLHSVTPEIEPIDLIDVNVPTEDLIRVAVQRRPEVGATAAAIGAAETQVRQEKARPLLPTLWVGYSAGDFGGGSNVTPPAFGRLGPRTDYDVMLYWTANGLGLGNLALIKRRQADVGEAVGEQARVINRVRREVTSAQALARAYRLRMENTRRELTAAQQGFREELDRIRNTVGRPVEATTLLRMLGEARINHLHAIVEYDRAQFQLFVALGSPPPLAPGAESVPLPPAPIAPPLTRPPSPSAANTPRLDPTLGTTRSRA